MRRPESWLALGLPVAVLLALVGGPGCGALSAQVADPAAPNGAIGSPGSSGGSTGAAVGGAALGLYSGAMLGVIGSLVPCTHTYAGPKCVRAAGITAGTIGLLSGAYIGANDDAEIETALRGSAYGFAIGSVVGFALKETVRQYGWADVLAAGGIGASIGASPGGSLIGIAAGTAVGAVLWQAIPSFDVPDMVSASLLGLTIGGLAGWAIRAVNANDAPGTPLIMVPLSVGF